MKASTKRMIAAINAARAESGERPIPTAKPKLPKCVGCFKDTHRVGCPNRTVKGGK